MWQQTATTCHFLGLYQTQYGLASANTTNILDNNPSKYQSAMMKLTELVVNGHLEQYSGAIISSWHVEQAPHNQATQPGRNESLSWLKHSHKQHYRHSTSNTVTIIRFLALFMAAVWNVYLKIKNTHRWLTAIPLEGLNLVGIHPHKLFLFN